MIYGYIRVSTREQNEDRQVRAMQEYGVPADCVYLDKQSGKDFERPAYKKLLRKLKPSDTVVISSIDRLGRNYNELLDQWRKITKEKGANIVVLDMPLLDTRNREDTTKTLIADLVLQIFSYVAQKERENIKRRQAEGIAAAKKRGVKFGRKPILKPDNFPEVIKEWQEGKLSGRKAAKKLDVSHTTFRRWATNVNPFGTKSTECGTPNFYCQI